MNRFLVTGATGFLGREVLVRLMGTGRPMMVLMRRRGDDDTLDDAQARLREAVESTESTPSWEGVQVAFGDVTERGLGLSKTSLQWLEEADGQVQIVHGAAQVRFDLPYEVMHTQNVFGTENVLGLAMALAVRRKLARLDYVSTTYIAGDRADVALETDIDVGQAPRNAYERSKLAAEKIVERARDVGLPVTVHRPSIIVGDSRTGRASSFKVLYWPMKVYARGRWRTVFGRPGCTVDAIPVDYVAEAMVYLLDREEATGHRVHLAAGPDGQSTIGELVGIAERLFDGREVRYFDPDIYHRYLRPVVRPVLAKIRPDVAERGGVFLPYLIHNPTFSVDVAERLLAPAGLKPPKVVDYFEAILRFARDTDFGRRAPDAPGTDGG